MSAAPLLAVKGLCKSFGGVRAVADIGFAVAAGTVVALIGPNGAGKSTCFNMLNGQLRPDAGRILLASQDITGLTPRRVWAHGVGRCFQITATFSSMTARENVQVALLAHAGQVWRFGRPAAALHVEAAQVLLAEVGLADQAARAAGVLAYGDLKRLELAMVLAARPRVLLMDEPTAGMAARERGALMALVRRMVDGLGLTVLFTEHDMDVVFGTADRILVLDRGALIAEGTPAAIRADARVRAVYLGNNADA